MLISHVFPQREWGDEPAAAYGAQVGHGPVLPMGVGQVDGQPVLLGELLPAELALEAAAAAELVDPQDVLVQRLFVGVHSLAQLAAKLFAFFPTFFLLRTVLVSQHHSFARPARASVSLDENGDTSPLLRSPWKIP